MTRAEMRAGLDLMPTWTLEQKAAANRQVIAIMGQRLAAGELVSAGTGGVWPQGWPRNNGGAARHWAAPP